MDGAAKDGDVAQKKGSLEALSREDLIKKCKGLLVIAQKAKQAKDEAGEEVKKLKEQLNDLKLQNEEIKREKEDCDQSKKEKEHQLQNEISAMQEMLATLTEQKLQFTMEIDKLKKQNTSLEKQLLSQSAIEEAKYLTKLEELETAAESYKRQNHRLADENEALIQQMDALETGMKEQTAEKSANKIAALEAELQSALDEVERLTEEDARKKEQMKQLYATFNNEKTEMQQKLEAELERQALEKQNLIMDLEEKEKVLAEIRNIEENNFELHELLKSLESDRDAFVIHSRKLNEEKHILQKQVDSVSDNLKFVMDENDCLKSENQHLCHLWDDLNKEISHVRSENNLLAMEKEDCYEELHSVVQENERLKSEMKHAEFQLEKILQQSEDFQYVNKVEMCEETEINDQDILCEHNSLSNIISLLEKNFCQITSLRICHRNIINDVSCVCIDREFQEHHCNNLDLASDSLRVLPAGEDITCCEIVSQEQVHMVPQEQDDMSQGEDNLKRLYSELKLLSVVISNLETEGECLQNENFKLKNSFNCLMKLKTEEFFMSQENENTLETILRNKGLLFEEYMISDENYDKTILSEDNRHSTDNMLSCKSCREIISQLQDDLCECQNSLDMETSEVAQLQKELFDLQQYVSLSEAELRNELDLCRQALSIKNTELVLVQEELSFMLERQGKRTEIDIICKEMTHSNKSSFDETSDLDVKNELSALREHKRTSKLKMEQLKNELSKANKVFETTSAAVKTLTDETLILETNVNKLQMELETSRQNEECLKSSVAKLKENEIELQKKVTDLIKELQIKCSLLEEKSAEQLMQEVNIEANKDEEKSDGEIHSEKEQYCIDSKFSDTCNNAVSVQHEKENNQLVNVNTEVNNLLLDLKSRTDQTTKYMEEKINDMEILKEEIAKLGDERLKLRSDLQEKSKVAEEREAALETTRKMLEDTNNNLKVTTDELQEKVSKHESEVQNFKFLLDEKSTELETAKEELEHAKENYVRLSEEMRINSSNLQTSIEEKEKEIESLKSTLLQADSNLAQTMVKFSGSEGELLNAQNIVESLKTQLANESRLLEEKKLETSTLKLSLEEKCTELRNIKQISEDTTTKHEILQLKIEHLETARKENESDLQRQLEDIESQYNDTLKECDILKTEVERLETAKKEKENDLQRQLKDNEAHCNESLKECEVLKEELEEHQSNELKLKSELIEMQSQCNEKSNKLESVSQELQILKSNCSEVQDKLKIAESYSEELLRELECVKNELRVTCADRAKIEDDLKFEKNTQNERVKDIENLKSELESVKDAYLMSTRQHGDMVEQFKEATAKLSMKEEELQDKTEELEESRQANNALNLKVKHMRAELISLSSKISHLNELRLGMSEEFKTFQSSFCEALQENAWNDIRNAVTNYIESEITVTKRESAELLGEMNEMNQVLKQRGETISKLKELNSDLEQRLREASSKSESVEDELKKSLLQLELKEKTVCGLEKDLASLAQAQQENLHMKNETIRSLEREVMKFKECQHELETKTSALEAKEEAIHNLEAKLIKQTDRLHQLDSKDQLIRSLEEELQNLKAMDKVKSKSDGASTSDEYNVKVKELENEVSSLKRKVQQLEHEAEEMRKESGDVHSEAMSSSTISRAEDSARLKDLEETFEERYTKLRIVAVRLKKRVSELTVQQTQLENDKKKLSSDKADLQAKVTQLSAHAKNLQTMQQEYDRLQDDLEVQKSEVKELTKVLEVSVNDCASLKVQLQECQDEKENKVKELESCLKDKQKIDVANKELALHINSLKKEKEAENTARKDKEKEVRKLEEDLKVSEKRLAEEIDSHKNTQEMLEASKQECKKRSVLSLEMEDYERSVADLTQQLAAEKSKVKEIDNHLETQRDISRGLQEQISLLEQRIQSEEARTKEVKEQLNLSRTRCTEVEALAIEREMSVAELASQIEQERDKNENLVLQLSELAAEKQRLIESARTQQDSLSRQVHALEEHVSHLKENLAEREAELADLRAEFGSYKVRAQSVLRQKARPDDGSSGFNREDYMEELAQLRQTSEVLRNKLEDASSKLQTVTVENNAVQEDRTRVLQRCQELADTVQDLRTQNSQLQTQLQETAVEHREALRSQKLQAETLNQCYKQQLEDLEENLQKETFALKKQLKEAEQRLHGAQQQTPFVGNASQTSEPSVVVATPTKQMTVGGSQWNNGTAGFIPVRSSSQQDSENKLEITLLEREEGEGSESVDSTSPHMSTSQEQRTELIPLDKLLSSPSEEDNNVSAVGASPSAELGRTKEQLALSDCRIKHLTGLLSEAERDLAKLTQQNQVLKEEIRRQQRSVEREQHAQNFEYLKNVILKFVTLQGGDERSRLVPVLNTILKLSPEETNQLNFVAKGGADNQGGGRSWGSYLQLWPGAQ